jgi:hypothetical protein
MALVEGLTATPALAHGGLIGAVVESAVALAVVGILVAVWLRERSARRSRASDGLSELDE